jgi:tetratricopeptide (TPR) repeat protein
MNAITDIPGDRTRWNCVAFWACPIVLGIISSASGVDMASYETYRQKKLAPMSAEFTRICEANAGDDAMREFKERIAEIDEVATLVVTRLHAKKAEVIAGILAGAPNAPKGRAPTASEEEPGGSWSIYEKYKDRFRRPLPTPTICERDTQFLRRYYNAALVVAGQYVAQQGKTVAALNAQMASEVVELYIVLPFLQTLDERWPGTWIETAPDWMRTKSAAKTLEDLALKLGRPLTALAFARQRDSALREPGAGCDYLIGKADALTKRGEPSAGIAVHRVAIAMADQAGGQDKAVDARIKLAASYRKMGHPPLAASMIEEALRKYPKASNWGKAALVRLMYLCEGKEYAQVIEMASRCEDDRRCKPYAAHILYVAWVAARRANRKPDAHKIQERFLKTFPKHPLCADMYYDCAMAALARRDPKEALRLLDIIEYRFPKSSIMRKVKSIRPQIMRVRPGQSEP